MRNNNDRKIKRATNKTRGWTLLSKLRKKLAFGLLFIAARDRILKRFVFPLLSKGWVSSLGCKSKTTLTKTLLTNSTPTLVVLLGGTPFLCERTLQSLFSFHTPFSGCFVFGRTPSFSPRVVVLFELDSELLPRVRLRKIYAPSPVPRFRG